VTIDVREEVVKHVMLIVPHSFEHSVVGVLGKLLCSRISHAIEAKPDPSADECFDALFVWGGSFYLFSYFIITKLKNEVFILIQLVQCRTSSH